MKKILIVTNHSYMLYRFRRELIQTLMQNYKVVLSMPFVGHEDDFQAMGLRCIDTPVDRRGLNPKTDWKLLMTYRQLIRQEQPDLVITYSIKPNIYAGLVCSRMKIPFCVNVQGLGTAFQRKGLAAFVTVLYRMALKKAKKVFFENQGNAQEFLSRKIIPQERICVLPGAGINLQEYPVQAYPTEEPVRFLYIGRLMKEKGMEELLDAMTRLYEQMGDRVVLDLVGFADDQSTFLQRIQQMEQTGAVKFHGFQSDPRPFYAMSHCVVLPSYHEGLSNVLLEAAAVGRPVITSDIYGCREAVEPGVSGLLCRVKDSDDLYEKMRDLALMTAQERAAMGLAGRARMECMFDKKIVVEQTVQAIFS